MKVLFLGATGSIGGEALRQCLAHPKITSVVAFVRRQLPDDVRDNPKVQTVMVKDFVVWPEDVLLPHVDAAAMVCAMGSYTGNVNVDMEYPFAFQVAFAPLLKKQPNRPRFRFIHLSGLFVIQDQKAKLWVNDFPRKLKGLYETRSQKLAEEYASVWRVFMLRPGGVITRRMRVPGKIFQILLGDEWVISNEELGAFFTYLVVEGETEPEETFLIKNPVIAQRGRKILREKQ
ncbi:Ff.00g036720.m01.CDS01 [Fusarium sp. VM40]|nr:Ff.00g036720.m01.CDS01 [Fusarium sp. VM40]